ncbi:type II toxin-antitoxin system VapC family toxin [Nocardioides humi]|nr:PIN domain-containing protein [Nocardioides humi]
MLDTSAVIGWVELQSEELVQWLLDAAGDTVPAIHAATLGELGRGVLEAPDETTRTRRRATLRFGAEELTVVPLSATSEQAHLFGVVSAAVSRKVSHNDCWITAAALDADDTVVTMDERLADQLRAAVEGDGHLADWLAERERTLDVKYCSR